MQTSLFDLENRYASLSEAGDPLERLNAVIDWEIFRPILARIDAKERKTAAGRKVTCRVLMFKLLVLQRLHNLSDERLQYQVSDRLSFMRFLGLELSGNVPDARTVWAFREALKEHRLTDALFERLNQALADLGVELKSGQIIDATFVPVPIQRNKPENNALIKSDAVPIEWGKTPAKLAQKDIDARWTKKGGQNHYGYKNHINIDRDTKLIAAAVCTAASVHDSQVLDAVLRDAAVGGKTVWADSAYRSDEQEQSLAASEHESQIHERAYRNKPLSEAQGLSNTEKSRVRARVEHVFGHMHNSMGGIFLRSIGAARAAVGVGLMNLTYNLARIEVLIRLKVFDFDRIGTPRIRTTG
ncbi:MAG: IS5 family transposase [Xanthomonadaceae bacterium]|jgi:IS5 family transposase|nr:IS5 family transposase [Xanthomonadaceae bacterium]MDP2184821.1 IS5 family transposase [Xanthomonadales bacterium]MDZ4116045.1 IS5 family transposase [Xanthomonadaceae bacterium]MDZ4376745.1 IS5 family transposase [Xanthomonadaceae bacterium]